MNTIGKKWSDLQARKFKANSQPFYVLLDPNTQTTLVEPQGADYDVTNYKEFLKSGIAAIGK